MSKKITFFSLLLLCALVSYTLMAQRTDNQTKPDKTALRQMALKKAIQSLPDSLFASMEQKDLVETEMYKQLARDGWNGDEIRAIMDNYIQKNRTRLRGSTPYGRYKKEWLPAYGFPVGTDSIRQYIDTTYTEKMMGNVRKAVAAATLDTYTPPTPYTPDDRRNGIRNRGLFRPAMLNPNVGRIHYIEVHPEDPNSLMVIPDGGGIFRTSDCGASWDCITDRIPTREHRKAAVHSAIPVDPDDWNHVFAFMNNGNPVYETKDGGQSWRQITGATHKSFKRGYAFRDKAGKLKFIGAEQNGGEYFYSRLWVSEDTCKTWALVVVPDSLKETKPGTAIRGNWFQQVAFDPTDRDKIYLPCSRSILYFDDGAKTYIENGIKVFHLKRMPLNVYDQAGATLRASAMLFPFEANTQSFLNVNPNNPNQMWFACSSRSASKSALYYSENKGATWKTLQEPTAGIGSGLMYGNEAPWGWLGGFGVNYTDPNWVYGCSMSSAISSDGGKNFGEFSWGNRLKALMQDGSYYHVSGSRHNADNHCIASHKSGRVFRASDSGLLMKDKNINGNQWTNIGGNMGQMLFYCVKTNEFGDQVIAGNTQDNDVHTYRYGRWGNYRGYEGSTAFMNPYGNVVYYPSGGDGLENTDYNSWNNGFTKADVCTGNWYLMREANGENFFRIGDFGRTPVKLNDNIGDNIRDFALARENGATTLFVLTKNNKIRRSTDHGATFTDVGTFAGSMIAADPNNASILYVGQTGKVSKINAANGAVLATLPTAGLPAVNCSQLFFHEGSGDIYFVHNGSGVYLKEKAANSWTLWMKGYNPAAFRYVDLNYTTQELILQDYGRGIYVADLQNPSDRYFTNNFPLKEISNINGRRTIGIDTKWTIPLYYNYQWKVNGVDQNNPYQYLTRPLNANDEVQLTLTLRESPDVSTTSALLRVQASTPENLQKLPGKALASNGKGRIDLGYVDYFGSDFTVEMWIKPQGPGVLLANRSKNIDRDAKGWILMIESGELKFRYAPANKFDLPLYETGFTQQADVNGGAIPFGKWTHVALTQQQNGSVTIYVNGAQTAQAARILPQHNLNNNMYLSLFADGYEYSPIPAAVDELKIWNYALPSTDVKMAMYSHTTAKKDNLVYYNAFNADEFTTEKELFTRKQPFSRTRAEVAYEPMPVAIGAEYAAITTLSGRTLFANEGKNLLAITSKTTAYTPQTAVYAYDDDLLAETNTNLSAAYHVLAPLSYQVRTFGVAPAATDSLTLEFFVQNMDMSKQYRIFRSDVQANNKNWESLKSLKINTANGTLTATVAAADLAEKRLAVIVLKPSIELTLKEIVGGNELAVYAETQPPYTMNAALASGLPEPLAPYKVISNNAALQPLADLNFVKGSATAPLAVKTDALGNFGNKINVTLSGEDNKMIPYPATVTNRIAPRKIGNSVRIENGGMQIGTGTTFAPANLSNTITLMGWVRLDSADMVSGFKPLMMFRGGGVATGIHLQDGNIRCHWNEESWSWNQATSLTIKSADVGRWMHIALVARPSGMDYYLNGEKFTSARTINPTRIVSELMLGQNTSTSDTYFNGAFDQIAMWNRSLTQDEVIRQMQNRTLLNDNGLIIYTNMDYFDAAGKVLDAKTDATTGKTGTVTANHRSVTPYDATASFKTLANQTPPPAAAVTLAFPAGKSATYHVSAFEGKPYNYVNTARTTDVPLGNEFYTVVYAAKPGTAAADNVTVTIRNGAVLATDNLAIYIRPLGSETAFSYFATAATVAAGVATFTVSGDQLNQAAELMLMSTTPIDGRAAIAQLTPATTLTATENNRIVLKDNENSVQVKVTVISSTPTDNLLLTVKETEYASPASVAVPVPNGGTFTINIDKTKINKFALNPLTLNVSGAEAATLVLNLSLEPKVALRLKNGTDENHYTATAAVATLDVEAELLQGILDEPLKLNVTADAGAAINSGSGALLTDEPFTHTGLKYTLAAATQNAGWNLIGNPFLANTVLTKANNVTYGGNSVSKFIYQYNKATNNYEVSDLTDYNAQQKIIPFQSYFVQTFEPNAPFTIQPKAKELPVPQTAANRALLRMTLSTNGVYADRTDICFSDAASAGFVLNEDALKLWSLSPATANQLYTNAATQPVAVNALPSTITEIPLSLKIAKTGSQTLSVDNISNFGAIGTFTLYDNGTPVSILNNGTTYNFTANAAGDTGNRFVIKINRISTGNENAFIYSVFVKQKRCYVSNLQGNTQILIADMQGKIRENVTVSTATYTSKVLQTGAYVVTIKENGNQYSTQILIK